MCRLYLCYLSLIWPHARVGFWLMARWREYEKRKKSLLNRLVFAQGQLLREQGRIERIEKELAEVEARLDTKAARKRRKLLTVAAEQAKRPDILNHWRRTISYPNDESA